MPILEVEIVTPSGSELPEGLAAKLADAAGKIFESPPERTWVRLRALTQGQYAENGGGPAEGVFPVFVTVLKGQFPQAKELQAEAKALAEVFGPICQRPSENVHIIYLPPAAGRIAFGGVLRLD